MPTTKNMARHTHQDTYNEFGNDMTLQPIGDDGLFEHNSDLWRGQLQFRRRIDGGDEQRFLRRGDGDGQQQ